MKKITLLVISLALLGNLIAQQWTTYIYPTGIKPILCNGIINDIKIDKQGNKWFGTKGGVSKFDGTTWINYSKDNGLSDNCVNAIEIDSQGNIWFGTNNGVSEFDGKKWIRYDTVAHLSGCKVNRIAIDNQGHKWFATGDGLFEFDGTKWSRYTAFNLIYYDEFGNVNYADIQSIYSVSIDSLGSKWLGTTCGVVKFDGKNWTPFSNVYLGAIDFIAIDKRGRIWCGPITYVDYETVCDTLRPCDDNGNCTDTTVCFLDYTWHTSINEYDGENWITDSTGWFLDRHINNIIVDSLNNKWFCTENGVSKFDGIDWTTYTTDDGLISNNVFTFIMDKQGNKWFGTDQGVSMFDGANWTSYQPNAGPDDIDNVKCIAIDSNGNKFFGTNYGLRKFDGTTWTTYTTNDGLADNTINAVKVDKNGDLWATTGFGISKFDGKIWTTFHNTSGIFSNYNACIVIDNKGNKWFSSAYYNVLKFNDTTWTTYPIYGPAEMSVDAQNNIWAVFAYGGRLNGLPVMKFDGTSWLNMGRAEALYSVAVDSTGKKWFTSRNSYLLCYDDSTWTSYVPVPPQNPWEPYLNGRIAADGDGNLWITNLDRGVYKFDGSNWFVYNTLNSGLAGNTVNMITIDSHGNKWFATDKGASKFDTKTRFLSVSLEAIRIASVENDTSFVISSNTNWSVNCDKPWLTISKTTGSDSATLSIIATINPSSSPRIAKIIVSGTGVNSDTIIVTQAASTTGIASFSNNDFNVYPNPVTERLYISTSHPIDHARIIIYSIIGIPVYTTLVVNNTTEIDLKNYNSGIYFVKIIKDDYNILTKKIIR